MKIVKIIDSSHVVIDAGENDGIKRGQQFRITGKEKSDVTDPDTGKSLGELKYIKGHIQANTVYEKMTVCTSIPKAQNSLDIQSMFSRTILPSLNIDADEITGGVDSKDKEIKVGDEVVKELG
ncbi:hypothetical protein FD12_GL001593 [Lentilactobacillus rapi DSM 19907 = JCM 15042]|uniref:Flagellar assembly protein T C-terminal domain-containing protein n=3 Tax=Lactobacillaceae TaxID=33958 RepID=A0A0R2FFP3_9LACO|nr:MULTISPECIES: hypothetical protein [Lactobacillaceae]KRL17664.1 hypothetical protein FD12_GL001593 [Lentilactobacillus rapi DSM 19907 = JCM 15042]KRN27352.1 hypothetical protein IV38_GL002187 [Lactobacillus selangorensis]GEP71975.1 hypothetical protein LRA02_08430 [Lentilactobacillus rapi]